jgi:integrase
MVRPRGTSWQADFTVGTKRFRKDFESKLDAELWESDTKSKLLRGDTVDDAVSRNAPRVTLAQLLEHTRKAHWHGRRGEDMAVKNATDCIDLLGQSKDADKVTAGDIDDMVNALSGRELANGTINRKLAALSKMLRHGQKRGWVTHLPEIVRRKESEHRIRWYSRKEEAAILAFFRRTHRQSMVDMVRFLIDTGVRLGEALQLRWQDASEGWVRVWGVESKGGRSRSVPMTDRVQRIVNRRAKSSGEEADRVFYDLDEWACEHAWRRCREALNMEDDKQFVLHTCRHTFATRAVQRKVPIPVVQKLLGHADITTTMRYSHVAADDLVLAVRGSTPAKPERKQQARPVAHAPLRLAQ